MIADAFLKANGVKDVLGTVGEPWFSWSFDWYGGSTSGGELQEYAVRFEPKADQEGASEPQAS